MSKIVIYIVICIAIFTACNESSPNNEAVSDILQTVFNDHAFGESITDGYKDSTLTIILTSKFNKQLDIKWNGRPVEYLDSTLLKEYSVTEKMRKNELPSLEVFITNVKLIGDEARADVYFRNSGITIESYLSRKGSKWIVDSTKKGWN